VSQSIEAAQDGVLDAILDLHSKKLFTPLLTDFCESVLPEYTATFIPLEGAVGRGQARLPIDVGPERLITGRLFFSEQRSDDWRFQQPKVEQAA